jgi:hypothetical protein
MDVFYLLIYHGWTPQLDGLVVLLPELPIFYFAVFQAGPFHQPQHPFFPAFLVMSGNGFLHSLGSIGFQLFQQNTRVILFCPEDQMHIWNQV